MFTNTYISLFDETKRLLTPDSAIIRCSKTTLLHLSHLLEEIILSRELPVLLFTGFQESSHWHKETARYQRLAQTARQVCVFAASFSQTEIPAQIAQISLAKEDPLRHEWFVVILSDVFSVLLCGKEYLGNPAVEDKGQREFETILNFSPAIINRVLDHLETILEHYHPETLTQLQAGRRRYPVPSINPELMTQVVSEMISYEEKLIRQVRQTEARLREETRLKIELDISDIRHLMLTTIAHEFRTPLTMIQSSGEMLERYFDSLSPEGRQKRLKTIKLQVLQLRTLLETVDTVLEVGSGKLTFQPESLNPVTLCQDLMTMLQKTILSHHQASFTHQWTQGMVEADERLLRLILTNLLTNAAKFSPLQSQIVLELTEQPEQMIFYIRDQGIGIPEHSQTHIYEAFYRGSNVGSIGGSGLGLKIVYDCVQLHQGEIDFTSNEHGTIFTITLPIQQRP